MISSQHQIARLMRLALVVASLSGCATTPPVLPAESSLLNFLRTGETTREQVLLKLGQPSASFEQERILTYRVGQDSGQGYYIVASNLLQPWQRVRYSMVLVFDAKGVLEKQSLVPVQ